MRIVLNHGFAGFDKMITSKEKEFLSRGKKRFHSSVLRFEVRIGKVKGEVGMPLVHEIEWRHISGRMGKIVICDFSSSKVFRPRRRVVSGVDTKILLESTISAFSLSISLWMISGREAKSSFSERTVHARNEKESEDHDRIQCYEENHVNEQCCRGIVVRVRVR